MTGLVAVTERAEAAPKPGRMRLRCTVLLAAHRTAARRNNAGLGLPAGVPDAELVDRTAAAVLADDPGPLERAIALVFRFGGPAWGAGGTADRATGDLAQAAALAQRLEPLAAAWVLTEAVRHALIVFDFDTAIVRSDAAVAALEYARDTDLGVFAAAVPGWLDPGEPALITRHSVWFSAGRARRRRRFEEWQVTVERAVEMADVLHDFRPGLFVMTASDLAALQRTLGTMADLSRWEEHAATSVAVRSSLLLQRAANAAHIGDRRLAAELHANRLDLELERSSVPGSADDLPALAVWVGSRPEPERREYNRIANAARECAVNLVEAGAAAADPAVRQRCEHLIDVADAIWHDWASNGVWAASHRRAILRLHDDPDEVLDMIEASRRRVYAIFRVNSAWAAATRSDRYREAVLARVEELLAEGHDPVGEARLHAARAWLRGPGTALEDPSAEQDALLATAGIAHTSSGSTDC